MPATERAWPEWARFTATAAAGVAVTLVSVSLWFADLRAVAAAAAADNVRQDAALKSLEAIAQDIRGTLVRTTTLLETTLPAQTRALEALEARLREVEHRK